MAKTADEKATGKPRTESTASSTAADSSAKPVSIAQLFKYATWSDLGLVLVGALGGMAVGAALPLFAVFLGNLTDEFQTSDDVLAVGEKYAALFGWLGLATFVGGFLQVGCYVLMSERLTLRIRKLYLSSVLKQEVSWFDTCAAGELASKVAENTTVIREGISEKLGALFQFMALGVTGWTIGLVFNWKLTLVVLSCAPLLGLGGYFMVGFMENATSGGLGAYARAGAVAEEAFTMIRVVQSYGIESRTAERYNKEIRTAEVDGVRKAKGTGIAFGVTFGVYFLSYALGFWYGSILVTDSAADASERFPFDPAQALSAVAVNECFVSNRISPALAEELNCVTNDYNEDFVFEEMADVCKCFACNCGCVRDGADCVPGGDIILVFFSVIIGSFALGQAAPSISALINARAAAGKIYEIIDRQPGIDASQQGRGAALVRSEVQGKYTLEGVKFRYPARPDVVIFESLDLTIERNQTTALVGGSGCGKSTVTQLLMRFYDPEQGRVTLDGRDVRELRVSDLRSLIGLVSQEPVLFATSIAQNIAYGAAPGSPAPTRAQIEAAAKLANAYEFVQELPEGFDTYVGERGSTMSGGQKQRIAIARALVRDPSLLILDEATSALDSESERIVQAALDNLLREQQRTTVVIAHRLSTVRNADKIVVLGANGGGLLEEGTHSDLMAKEGFYAALVAAAERSQEAGDGEEVDIKRLLSEDNQVMTRFGSSASGRIASGSFQQQQQQQRLPSAATLEVDESDARPEEADAAVGNKAGAAVSAAVGSAPVEAPGTVEVTAADGKGKGAKKEEKEELYKVPLSRLLQFSGPEKRLFPMALLCAAINGATMPSFAILFSSISQVYFLPTQALIKEEADRFALYFVALSVAVAFAYHGQFRWFGIIGEKMTTRVRAALFAHLLRQETAFFDEQRNSVGALTSKLATDAALVKAAVTDKTGLLVMNLFTVVIGLSIAFAYGWQLSLVLLALLPLIVAAGVFQMLVMSGLANEDDKALADAGQVLSEAISGIRTVTAFDLRDRVVLLYDSFLAGPSKIAVRKGATGGFAFGFSQGVLFAIYGIAFFYGSRLMDDGDYTFQDVMNVFFAVVLTGFGIGNAAAMSGDVAKASVGVSNVFRVLDRKSKIDAFSKDGLRGAQEGAASEDIVFSDVDFAYPTRRDAPVYSDMSLRVPGGKVVALVGASGSGKSTCISLVERFYDADGGRISVRGVDVREANVAWLREQMGLVQQEGQLFATTVFENIANGLPADVVATQEAVEAAARKANAHDFIVNFPDGYQTMVGPQGSQLSGGQRQRICLARCLIRRPKVLLLDEATSALDNESQRVVQDALDAMIAELKCTTLVVAHRLTTVQNADLIVVFAHGVPVEQGTHDALLQQGGAYAALWRAQMGEEAQKDEETEQS